MRLTLTKETEHALRALVWLSAAEETARARGLPGCHKAAAISGEAHIPPVFAARILAQLRPLRVLAGTPPADSPAAIVRGHPRASS